MIKMSETDLIERLDKIIKDIAKNKYDSLELARQVAIYNFIKYELLGE